METASNHERDVGAGKFCLPQQRFLATDLLGRDAGAVGKLELDRRPLVRNEDIELDEIGAYVGRRVHNRKTAARNLVCDAPDGASRELVPDLLGFCVPNEHLRGHLVGRAAADRIVRRVLEHARPGLREERLGPVASVQSLQRLGVAFEPAFRARARGFQVDPGGDDARQQVRARTRAQLAVPVRQTLCGCVGEVLRERPHDDSLRNARHEVVRERHVVGADHAEQVVVAVPRAEALLERFEPRFARDIEQVGGVPVPRRQVLGDDSRAVQAFPHEPVEVDRRGNAPPDHRRLDSGETEDLRHLRDVTEHVREVADAHRASKLGCPRESGLEIAQRRLAVDEELVHERLPRAEREPPGSHECANPFLCFRPNLQIVVECRELAVECEAHVLVALELAEHLVDHVHQRDPERLERPVPLPVPVGVRNEEDAQVLTEPARRPCTK